MDFKRQLKATQKKMTALRDGNATWQEALTAMDKLFDACEVGNQEHYAQEKAIRADFRAACNDGALARSSARNAGIAALTSEVNDKRKNHWTNA